MSEISENRKLELKRELSVKYHLNHFSLEIGNQTFHLATVTNIDELLEDLLAKGDDHVDVVDERIPYWADLWHAAIGLTEYILTHDSVDATQQVLEVGCGLGLCGLAAAQKGASVILTDYLPEALLMAEYIWLLNREDLPDCRLMDWRDPRGEWASDLIIASDVAYEKRAYEPLMGTFQTCLNPDGKVLLSEPGRKETSGWLNELESRGFSTTMTTKPVHYRGITNHVSIYELDLFQKTNSCISGFS